MRSVESAIIGGYEELRVHRQFVNGAPREIIDFSRMPECPTDIEADGVNVAIVGGAGGEA